MRRIYFGIGLPLAFYSLYEQEPYHSAGEEEGRAALFRSPPHFLVDIQSSGEEDEGEERAVPGLNRRTIRSFGSSGSERLPGTSSIISRRAP